jgi:hypothetical protein
MCRLSPEAGQTSPFLVQNLVPCSSGALLALQVCHDSFPQSGEAVHAMRCWVGVRILVARSGCPCGFVLFACDVSSRGSNILLQPTRTLGVYDKYLQSCFGAALPPKYYRIKRKDLSARQGCERLQKAYMMNVLGMHIQGPEVVV